VTRSVEIPDAAVEAAAKAACEATYPPNPSGRVKVHDSWEEIEEWERDAWRATARAALVAARPYLMPSREEIAVAAHKHFCVMPNEPTHEPDEIDYDKADEILEILALMNWACTCPTDHDVTPDMRTETGQHLTGCPMASVS
jgi:hypothetical protein